MTRKSTLPFWKRVVRAVAWTFVIASFPIWAAAFLVVPFLPISGEQRAAGVAGCVVIADVIFWVAVPFLGAETIARFWPPKVTTGKSYSGKRVAVIGATGRIGEAIVRAVQREGGTPLVMARDEVRLRALASELALAEGHIAAVDVAAPGTLRAAAEKLRSSGPLDYVICATGMNLEKRLEDHSEEELARCVEVDLLGPVHVTRAFLPALHERGVIALFGGFGDGGVALPHYAIDVAARAGLAGFCAAVNREIQLQGREQVLCYVSPAPLAMEPVPSRGWLWNKLSPPAVPSEVANFVLRMVLARRAKAVMGLRAQLLAWLQGTAPWFGHMIMVNLMSPAQRARLKPTAATTADRLLSRGARLQGLEETASGFEPVGVARATHEDP